MSSPFVGEVKIFGCNFAPTGWAFCNGQLLPISQNTALFSLLGTYYGGNGTTNFALPNLQASAAVGFGQGPGLSNRDLGEVGGSASVTLLTSEIPSHTHNMIGSGLDGVSPSTVNAVPAGPGADRDLYWYNPATTGTLTTLSANALAVSGGSQPHNNQMRYLALNFCIALQGIFPARN